MPRKVNQQSQSWHGLDNCLWMALAVATGAQGNSTVLAGTPETVVEALVAYYDLGATSLLISGYDPLADAVEYGRALIPRVRAHVCAGRREPLPISFFHESLDFRHLYALSVPQLFPSWYASLARDSETR